MTIEIEPQSDTKRPDEARRRLLSSGLAGGAAFTMSQNVEAQEKVTSAGPIKEGRGSQLTGKVAVVTARRAALAGRSRSKWRPMARISPPSTFAAL